MIVRRLVTNVALVGALVGAAFGCAKKEGAGAGSASASASGSASASASASGSAAAPGSAAASSAGSAAAPAARADVAAFTAVFDPVNSKLDHVSRARTACEQRTALVDAAKAIDKSTAPAGKDAAAWTASVDALLTALDEAGEPCDEGNIKAIEAKLDAAKSALDALAK